MGTASAPCSRIWKSPAPFVVRINRSTRNRAQPFERVSFAEDNDRGFSRVVLRRACNGASNSVHSFRHALRELLMYALAPPAEVGAPRFAGGVSPIDVDGSGRGVPVSRAAETCCAAVSPFLAATDPVASILEADFHIASPDAARRRRTGDLCRRIGPRSHRFGRGGGVMRHGVDVQRRDGAGLVNYGSGRANSEAARSFASAARGIVEGDHANQELAVLSSSTA